MAHSGPEYGTAETAQFSFFSTRRTRTSRAAKYPAILVTAGENDTRVHRCTPASTPRRWAATASDPQSGAAVGRYDGGHGQGKPLSLRVRDVADQYGFLMWQTGLLGKGARN